MENSRLQSVRQRRNLLPSRSYDQDSQPMSTNIISKSRRLINLCQIYLLRLLELSRLNSGSIRTKLIFLFLTLFCAHQYHLMSRDNQYVPPSKETDATLRVRDVQYVPPLKDADATLVVLDKQNVPPLKETDDPVRVRDVQYVPLLNETDATLLVLDNQNVPPSNQENEAFTFQDRQYVPPYKKINATNHGNTKFHPVQHVDSTNCLYFQCKKNEAECDNYLPTDYDGNDPPCCVHILRDMSRAFDESMQRLGLDYSATFGTILGLMRSDRMIPWTEDSDYMIPSKDIMDTMVERWDRKAFGLELLFQGIPRVCATAEFEGGKLQKWIHSKNKRGHSWLCWRGHPYLDLYVGQSKGSNKISHHKGCLHDYSHIFPTKRMMVYNNTFAQNVPADPEEALITYYGKNWRLPPETKSARGGKACDT